MAVAPPRKVTVKLVLARRFAAGVMVTTVPAAFMLTVAAITPPPVRAIVAVVEVAPTTLSLKVAVMVPAFRFTFTALAAGLVAITVGTGLATSVVKLHDVVASGKHGLTRLRIPVPLVAVVHVPPETTTVYSVFGNKFAVGLMVNVRPNSWVTLTGTRTPAAEFPWYNLTLALPPLGRAAV